MAERCWLETLVGLLEIRDGAIRVRRRLCRRGRRWRGLHCVEGKLAESGLDLVVVVQALLVPLLVGFFGGLGEEMGVCRLDDLGAEKVRLKLAVDLSDRVSRRFGHVAGGEGSNAFRALADLLPPIFLRISFSENLDQSMSSAEAILLGSAVVTVGLS